MVARQSPKLLVWVRVLEGVPSKYEGCTLLLAPVREVNVLQPSLKWKGTQEA